MQVHTQWPGKEPVHDDVSVASNGGRKVSVQRNVEGVVLIKLLVRQYACAEVQRHLGKTKQNNNTE